MELNRLPQNYQTWGMGAYPFATSLWSHRTIAGREDAIPPRFLDGGSLLFEMETRAILLNGPRCHVFHHHLPGTHRIGLTLRPGVLQLVFGIAAEEVVNSMECILPPRSLQVPDSAWESEPAMLAFLRSFMVDISSRMAVPRDIMQLSSRPAPYYGMQTVRSWANGANLTERTLHRQCLRLFGMSPKAFLRVARLSAALARLISAGAKLPSISAAALDAGYADQSHFCHECRDLLDCSPGEALRLHGVFFML